MTIFLFLQRRATALYSVLCLDALVLENPRLSCNADIHKTLLSIEHLVSHLVGTVPSQWSNSLNICIRWHFLTIKGVKLLVPDVAGKKSQATQSCPENCGRGRFVCDSHLLWWDLHPSVLSSVLKHLPEHKGEQDRACGFTVPQQRMHEQCQQLSLQHQVKAAQD